MPRLKPEYFDFFHSPLTEDVEELLARFQQTDSVRYEEFSAIWREMKFSHVFLGIERMSEMKRFSRISLATAMKYFLPPYSYQIRVGGLYLMFGFFRTQLAVPPVKIRLALRDWAAVQKFLKDSVESGHQDVVYVYWKLVVARAFHYTAMPHFLTFQKQKNQKKEPVCVGFLGRTTAVQELISSEFLEELSNIHAHYEKLKEDTVEVGSQVNMMQGDLAASLKDTVFEFFKWQQKNFSQDQNEISDGDEDEKQCKTESSSRARLLSAIKQKSFCNFQEASKSRRHRQAQTLESSSSGTEQVQEQSRRGKRPPSLRARTWESLGVPREESMAQAWLLSAPEKWEKVPGKRTNQVRTFRP